MQKRVEIGIDEAGRGAIIGPMVVAGIKADDNAIHLLRKIGVRDSKRLSPSVRERLYGDIIKLVESHEEEISSAVEIDADSLTVLELKSISRIVGRFEIPPSGRIVMDCIGKLAKEKVEEIVNIPRGVELVYEPKADDFYPVCQAASIVAKVIRDREIRKIHGQVGFDFGKGYPTKGTMDFIRKYKDENGVLPPEIRKRWGNIGKML